MRDRPGVGGWLLVGFLLPNWRCILFSVDRLRLLTVRVYTVVQHVKRKRSCFAGMEGDALCVTLDVSDVGRERETRFWGGEGAVKVL